LCLMRLIDFDGRFFKNFASYLMRLLF